MIPQATCQVCGTPVPKDAPFGHCPRCLMQLGFGPASAETAPAGAALLGDYELLDQIGRGGMGVVYKARQVSLNRFVAVKMLSPQCAAFPAVAERIRLEAEAAASLHHPHIVTIYEVAGADDRPFFSMELIEGSGLDKLIGPGGFSPDQGHLSDPDPRRGAQAVTARILATIARAVEYAHRHGVLHRDLKPANVILDAAGEPHLTDFGLAKVLNRERATATGSGQIIGTPAYMSPEQAAGDPKRISTASDVYSLGAILYAMLTGHPPFHADTPLETLRQVTEQPPKHPSSLNGTVNRDLAIICLKCLEKEPHRRYSSAQALAEDLERWLRNEPIEARRVGIPGRMLRWCRREPRLAATVAAVILLLAASTLLALALYGGKAQQLKSTEQAKIRQRSALLHRIAKEGQEPDRPSVRIFAEELFVLTDRPYTVEGNELRVVFGVPASHVSANPVRVVQRFLPLVNLLHTNNHLAATQPVFFELQVYSTYANALQGVGRNEVDLMRVDPASYVLLRRADSKLTPIAQEAFSGLPGLFGVMFTRTNSGLMRLADLRGKSMAFGEKGSAIGEYVPKAELLAAGLHAADLSLITNVPSAGMVSAIHRGQFDAGIAYLDDFAAVTNSGVGLRMLQLLQCPGHPWVVTRKLDTAVAQAIQGCLLSLRDTAVLSAVDHQLTGFGPATPSDYDSLEARINQARLFDEARRPGPP